MRFFYFYLPMFICVIAVYTLQAYLSNFNNAAGGKFTKYTVYLYLSGLFPMWTVISMYTKNMFFDALLYDTLVTVVFAIAILFFTGQHLKPINWLGAALIVAGLILVKR